MDRAAVATEFPTHVSHEAEGGEGYKGKMCVICSGKYVASYNIFILDFDSAGRRDDFMKISPALRIEDLGRMCFLVLDSFLYVFDDVADFVSRSGGTWMYRYDLRPHFLNPESDILIDDVKQTHQLQGFIKCPDMNHPKRNPRAIPTPDGTKILVYSQLVRFYTYEGEEAASTDVDFEVYDTRTSKWTQLPQLCILIKPYANDPGVFSLYNHMSSSWNKCSDKIHDLYHSFEDKSYRGVSMEGGCFINRNTDENTFLVRIPAEEVMFTLNIDRPEQGWNVYDENSYNIPLVWPFRYGYRLPENLVVTPFTVSNKVGSHQFPLSEYPGIRGPECYRVSILDYVENKECVVCIVSGGISESEVKEDPTPYIICDLFKLHLRSDATHEIPASPTRLASFKYDLTYSTQYFYVENSYHIPMAIEAPRQKDEDILVGETSSCRGFIAPPVFEREGEGER